MKKLISVIVAAIVLATLSVPVFAAGTTTAPSSSAATTIRTQLKQDRASLIASRDANKQSIASSKSIRTAIKADIASLKASKTKLTAAQIATLKADNAQIKSIMTQIQSTKGSIATIQQQNKDAIKNKDATTLDANLKKILAIQDTRNQQLTQINGILKSMESLLSGIIAGA